MMELLNHESSECQFALKHDVIVYLDHGIGHRGEIRFFTDANLWVRYGAPQIRSLKKNQGEPLS